MKGRMSTELGSIVIDTDAIAQYAGSEAMECFGIVGMAAVSMKDGLVKLLKGENLGRGINVVIIVSYGVSIQAVARNLIDYVKYKLEKYT